MTDTLLDVQDLSVAFRSRERETLAVDRVSFTIHRGETVALVGESGSGKSVTALSILRLLDGSAVHPGGRILFKGRDILVLPEPELRKIRGADITMVFQEPMTSLNPLHTIQRQIGEVLEIHRGLSGRKARARILELLELVGVRDAERRMGAYPHELSGGQRQRVMIAMALACEPDLLVADEPTTALDVTVQAQILTLLADLQKRLGMSMLFITHDLGIVQRIASRVCVMLAGRIVEAGPVDEIFARPKHEYTQRLLASEPKGRANPVADDAPRLLEAGPLKVWFPVREGLLRRTTFHVKAVDGVSLAVREGETIGIVGESGSGKTTLGLALLRLTGSEGPIVFLGQSHCRARPRTDATVPARHAGGLPGPLRLALAAHDGGRHRRRGPRRAGSGEVAHRAARRGRQGTDRCRSRSGDDGSLPARIFRRPAPAHRHRPRHGAENRASSSSTNRPRPSIGRFRLRSSPCSATCRRSASSPTSSSVTISRSCARWRTTCW